MNKIDHLSLIKMYRDNIVELERVDLSCCGCEHFRLGSFCDLYEDTIPDEVIKKACEAWEYDNIPF